MSFKDLVERVMNPEEDNQLVDLSLKSLDVRDKEYFAKMNLDSREYFDYIFVSPEERELVSKLKHKVDKNDIVEIVKCLLGQLPEKDNKNLYGMPCYNESAIKILTTETLSVGVGIVNDAVFKIYDSEENARKEFTILSKLQNYKLMQGRCQVLDKATDLSEFPYFDALIGKENLQRIVQNSKDMDFMKIGDYYIILTRKERETNPIKDFAFLERYLNINPVEKSMKNYFSDKISIDNIERSESEKAVASAFNKVAKALVGTQVNENYYDILKSIKSNVLLQRLMTLSLLHSGFRNEFSEKEVRELDLVKYHDFSYEEIAEKTQPMLNDYESVFDSQLQQAYMNASERQKAIHYSRAEKDESGLDKLVFTHGDTKWDNWMDDSNVLIDFGSSKISTEYKDIAKALLDSKEILDIEKIDDYVEAYAFMRQSIDLPIQEDLQELKRNVHDSILLEAMRILYYKPDNKRVSQHMINVIEAYKPVVLNEFEKAA